MEKVTGVVCFLLVTFASIRTERSFTVDYENNCFLKDGQPFQYVSGSMHYFRSPKATWKDRLLKMRAAGLNAVQTYVEWSGHEPEQGQFNFEGDYDLGYFLQTAQEVGLLVILRPGPYICAERDNGGLPYWLLRLNSEMKYRTSDPTYLSPVISWFKQLLPRVKPYLYDNGGPIITVQVENEYGQYPACDKTYLNTLINLLHEHLGPDVILFRTDAVSANNYNCDNVSNTLVAGDFNPSANLATVFSIMRQFMPKGPLVVAEYYPGWMDHWGSPHAGADNAQVVGTLEKMLALNASVNFYMFHGGTNFGFSNGANAPFSPQVTSYDYNAPLSEAGDPMPAYYMIRESVGKYLPLPPGPPPKPSPKLAIGMVNISCGPSLDAYLEASISRNMLISEFPLSFEEIGQDFGYIVYKTSVQFGPPDQAVLSIPGLRDRAYVLTSKTRAVLSRERSIYDTPIKISKGETLTVIVENRGRINYGEENHDPKGILSNVTLDGTVLTNWTMQPVPISKQSDMKRLFQEVPKQVCPCSVPGFFFAQFQLPEGTEPLDTFLDPSGWTKGVAFVNEFNLGRYWPVMGPQVTLYVPGVLLKPYPQVNTLILFETEARPSNASDCTTCTVKLVDTPIIDGPTP